MEDMKTKLSKISLTVILTLEEIIPLMASVQKLGITRGDIVVDMIKLRERISVALIKQHEYSDISDLDLLGFTGVLTKVCVRTVDRTATGLLLIPNATLTSGDLIEDAIASSVTIVAKALQMIEDN